MLAVSLLLGLRQGATGELVRLLDMLGCVRWQEGESSLSDVHLVGMAWHGVVPLCLLAWGCSRFT